MSKKKIAIAWICPIAVTIIIVILFFFNLKTTGTKIYSGKWEVILSLTQNDREITVTDIDGSQGIFELPREIKYDLGSKGPFVLRQTLRINGKNQFLKYRYAEHPTSISYQLSLKPGEKQRFDLLFMPQWEITFRNWFGWKFSSVRQYAGKFNCRRTDLADDMSDKVSENRSGGENAKKGNR